MVDSVSPLAVTEVVYSLQTGGSERIGADIARHLRLRGADSSVCATHGGGGPVSDGLRQDRIPWCAAERESENRIQRAWRVYRHLRSTRCRVLHAHHFNMLAVSYAPARLAGVDRIVVTEHSDYLMKSDPDTLQRARKYARRADHVTVVHAGLKDFVCGHLGLPEGQVSVVPNGVDTEYFSPGPRGQMELPGPADDGVPVRLCMVGRLHPDKDHLNLLAAVAGMRSRGVGPFLVYVVGDGPELPGLRQHISDLSLTDCVFLLGDRRDVRNLLREMDVFVLSSRTEGLPVALLEAMSCGLPCVATDVGGVAAALSAGGGLVVPRKDSRALCEALTNMIQNEGLRHRSGEAARFSAQGSFDRAAMFDEYERILQVKD